MTVFKTLPDLEENDSSEWEPPTGYMDALKHFAETEEEEDPISIVFKGKIFVLTGFDSRDENQITEIITSRGWHC